jgi:hypothetical protein
MSKQFKWLTKPDWAKTLVTVAGVKPKHYYANQIEWIIR